MATKTEVHTSLMKNSPSAKPTANKGKAKTGTAAAKGGTSKAAGSNSKAKPSNRNYTRNGSMGALIGSGLAAFGGAAVITGFDMAVNQFMPQISAGIRTTVKFGAGIGFKMFGKKIPVIGGYSETIGNAFLLAGALDVLGNTVVPYVVNWLGAGTVSKPLVVQDTATGQLGYQYNMPNGEVVTMFDDTSGGNSYVPQSYGSYAPQLYGGGYQGGAAYYQ